MEENTSISLNTAIRWIRAWRERNDISGESFKASQIPMEDVNAILGENDAAHIRAYNGYNEETGMYKLILVGVDASGKDIIPRVDPDDAEGSGLYDLTLPCPDTCDTSSPLFTLEP